MTFYNYKQKVGIKLINLKITQVQRLEQLLRPHLVNKKYVL